MTYLVTVWEVQPARGQDVITGCAGGQHSLPSATCHLLCSRGGACPSAEKEAWRQETAARPPPNRTEPGATLLPCSPQVLRGILVCQLISVFPLWFWCVGGHIALVVRNVGELVWATIAFAHILKGINSYYHENLFIFLNISKFFMKQSLKLLGLQQ